MTIMDGLAHALAEVTDGGLTHHLVGDAVLAVERLAGIASAPVHDEALVVLQRRFGRAHGRSVAPLSGADEALLLGLTAALADPADALLRASAGIGSVSPTLVTDPRG